MPKLTIDPQKPPSEGERAARRGYLRQDDFSARRIYSLLLERSFAWVGWADRDAGVLDDLVLGTTDGVLAHQIKSSKNPQGIGVTALLLGKGEEVKRLASSFLMLRKQFPDEKLRLIYVTDDPLTKNDCLLKDEDEASTEQFMRDWNANRFLFEKFKNTKWKPLLDQLRRVSELNDAEFADFFTCFEVVAGSSVSRLIPSSDDVQVEQQILDLRDRIPALIVENDHKSRWSRQELLQALNWPDSYRLRFDHRFPLGNFVQKNEQTEAELQTAIDNCSSGYLGLVGPPGSGKSTLLQRALKGKPGVQVLRYLAFVPGSAQGQGRGEADNFFDDLNAQFSEILGGSKRLFETSRLGRQRAFEGSLLRAGKEFSENGTRFMVVVDGLDHIPREEMPDRSLLSALPLPDAVPDGVVFVLGTQRIDLSDMPVAVRSQASKKGRQVSVQPLNFGATKRMSDQLGLPIEIDRRSVHDVGQGHPLVTRYLVELLRQDPTKADDLLGGAFVFDGDLEKVYETAWLGASSSDGATLVQQVLLLIAFAQGGIEPDLLASATSDEAVETALKYAGHLLQKKRDYWDVFHNSFRLFLREKAVLRFGKPDEAFRAPKVYSTLAELSGRAMESSPQRWLAFRYLFLAGEHERALAMSGRQFFVQQYLDGRSPYDVHGDISDAYRLVENDRDPEKLFDLMLAGDEVSRRSEVFEGVDPLIDAYLAAGLFDTAIEQLRHTHPAGKEWLVVDALLEQGRLDQARDLFEEADLFGGAFASLNVHTRGEDRAALEWARRAVRFMDRSSLVTTLKDYLTGLQHENRHSPHEADLEEVTEHLRYCLARASVELTEYSNVDELLAFWAVDENAIPLLRLEHAENLFAGGDAESGLQVLKTLTECSSFQDLHSSWHLSAARMAFRAGDQALARSIAKLLSPKPLDHERYQLFEAIGPASVELVSVASLFSALDLPLPDIVTPKERLFRGAQHHLIELGRQLGAARTRGSLQVGEVSRVTSEAMQFLASARLTNDDDWSVGHLMPTLAAQIALALIELIKQAKADYTPLVRAYDQLILQEGTAFRWWLGFRRKLILGLFNLDGDRERAIERLNAALQDIRVDDPQEALSEKVEFAIACAKVGDIEPAQAILRGLRSEALGSYRPAKKDGDYELWTDVLALANQDDPSNRKSRSLVAVRLVDGLQNTSGYDKAARMAQQVLFEASVPDATTAWSAVQWATDCGAFSWFGVLDSCLHGLVVRSPEKANVALLVWCHLALPWLHDGWRSTTETGAFLERLFQVAPREQLDDLEEVVVHAIGTNAPPYVKTTLLRIVEDAAKKRYGGGLAETARNRWQSEEKPEDEENPDNRDYGHLVDFGQISVEIEHEAQYHKKRNENWHIGGISYGLRKAIVRVIGAATWAETDSFLGEHPKVTKDWESAKAFAEKAVQAGRSERAREILKPFKGDLETGWSWPSSRGRFRHHQIRHIVGESDAHNAALHDFVEDIAVTKYGVSTTLWSIDEIFPLLFETVPWAGLWNRLEDNIRAGRDFQAGSDLPLSDVLKDDDELVVRLVEMSLDLGVTDLALQASNLVCDLLDQRQEPIVESLIRRLLGGGGEKRMRAMDLLVQSHENRDVRRAFRDDLSDLVSDPDVGVSASAFFLGSKWGQPLEMPATELPPFYSLEFALDDRAKGTALRDDHSHALLLDDALGWTEHWLRVVEVLEDFSGIPAVKIRIRVARLVSSWGGINVFGHEASKQQEAKLSRVGIKLTYRRPHSEVAIRALRHVARELWFADHLSFDQVRLVLHELHCDPDRAKLPMIEERPPTLPWPDIPRHLWGDKLDEWLENVALDVAEADPFFGIVIGEFREWKAKDSRDVLIVEQLMCDRLEFPVVPSLDEALSKLGRVVRIGYLVALDASKSQKPDPVCRFLPHQLDLKPSQFIVLNPEVAKLLNWHSITNDPYVYYDSDGNWCAKTIVWRDGLFQSIDDDGRYGNGQMVTLSKKGREAYEQYFGPISIKSHSWRRTEKSGKKDIQETWRFAVSSQ